MTLFPGRGDVRLSVRVGLAKAASGPEVALCNVLRSVDRGGAVTPLDAMTLPSAVRLVLDKATDDVEPERVVSVASCIPILAR